MAVTKTRIATNGVKPDVLAEKTADIRIAPMNEETIAVRIIGTAPLVLHKFSTKSKNILIETQQAGSLAKKGKKRDPKNFEENFNEARYLHPDGWDGINASAFRTALVDCCRLVGFHMTKAKLAIFCVEDGYDSEGTPLVRITKGTPRMHVGPVRNATGVIDLRARPMWEPGWEAIVRLRYDADQFSASDVVNLLARVGRQCGLGEGRPNSRDCCGCGWGLFEVRTA